MASNNGVQINDVDDDGFDWDAAVMEIDIACQNTKPSNSVPIGYSHLGFAKTPFETKTNNKPGTSRQSTLDKFMGRAGPKLQSVDQNVHNSEQEKIGGNERFSFIDIDPEAAKTWIYPVNVPLRKYQFAITRTALFSNTLVALPTGLGKTLIAAVVMYNYFRWFPEGKIVFAAPSRPLVVQQIEACHNIVGIPQEWTIDMTGKITPAKRACFWKAKRVFFVTPQVLEKDIESGKCSVKHLVCLVIDEAHRATGNFSYCVAVRKLMALPVQIRILALTATPGSKKQVIQNVIDNLQISTLEYRNENDRDVSPYVHDRIVELIEVPMGKDADGINNLLLDVIRPIVARLSAIGVLPNRDFQTLSPCDLLISRDKFREAPPPNLPLMKHGEIHGSISALITLYHIRKLLSSHGIRPAFEMLDAKLRKEGYFARSMSKNEVIWKAKLLMEKNLSHGAPSPKLSKMLFVLVDHFKIKDPQNSRVIIFSNFRDSVSDIMDALSSIGDFVKAAQFIGQSSGKSLKGQSQKAQQAVLEKFRAGVYNVIVATSIGEEGLDIMEVDLVICFDANISPLRMIQRMGRTGRKHEGRVVVLACEGTELKGYHRKQANSKNINKHMLNGGVKSFSFHSSPRMIPHIFKPEVQYVELAIEQFVSRERKPKDDHPTETPLFKAKLTDGEADLIAKYFQHTRENSWKPSLIAFPHFQAIPSKVHEVMHSFRTEVLVETMQNLQGLSYCKDIKDAMPTDWCWGVESMEQQDNNIKESWQDIENQNFPEVPLLRGDSKSDEVHGILRNSEKHVMQGFQEQNRHSFLFGSDFVSVDALGRVLIVPVVNYLKKGSFQWPSLGDKDMLEKDDNETERTLQSAILGECTGLEPHLVKNDTAMLLADESSDEFRDIELSPRLSNFIQSGVVPESPIHDAGVPKGDRRGEIAVSDVVSPPKLQIESFVKSPESNETQKTISDGGASGRDVLSSAHNCESQIPVVGVNNNSPRGGTAALPDIEEVHTPLAKFSNNSCSKDWCLNSGDKSESVQQERKFKRLRKYGDLCKRKPGDGNEETIHPKADLAKHCVGPCPVPVQYGRGKKQLEDARGFIEEEAEVSPEFAVSDDEEDEQQSNSYEDSFIDDRIDPTAGSTQAETSRSDMMAIYRRSLLTQSPMGRLPRGFVDFSPDSVSPKTRISENGSSSGPTSRTNLATPTVIESSGRNPVSSRLIAENISSEGLSRTINLVSGESESSIASRKRKLKFYQAGSVSAINLEPEFLCQSENAGKESERFDTTGDAFDDDEFYEGLDLDAVEEQAAELLRYKSQLNTQKNTMNPEPTSVISSPSFDLGI